MFRITCQAMRHTSAHPLAREVHFSLILLGLQVLRYNTSLSGTAQWRFKDDLLSAALAWFAHSPRYADCLSSQVIVTNLKQLVFRW